jgi:hypothetical protein
MVTELQRQQLLAILDNAGVNKQDIIRKAKETHGVELTPQQIDAAIKQLRQVRGE